MLIQWPTFQKYDTEIGSLITTGEKDRKAKKLIFRYDLYEYQSFTRRFPIPKYRIGRNVQAV